ncbi:hypothetical protein PAXRUDRAFT_177203 [Paxillus rubicundulus Ve08.2h10]|uniref:Uncharacterized protein n=1 Tax=Paxillus rubicundulus Ve08.2h10 TaxID=930991 RepID=A0A0D0CEH6_9AGAM|nr:hypothetical protein PAXRUDRAFT_177203 [Paxillus rubicundulus Ve08.2h10]
MAGSNGNISSQQTKLSQLLTELHNAIKALLSSIPEGSKSGPIATQFCSWEIDEEEGPFFPLNKTWERVFQQSEAEQKSLVVQGKFSLQMAHSFCAFFSQAPGIETNNGLGLMIL